MKTKKFELLDDRLKSLIVLLHSQLRSLGTKDTTIGVVFKFIAVTFSIATNDTILKDFEQQDYENIETINQIAKFSKFPSSLHQVKSIVISKSPIWGSKKTDYVDRLPFYSNITSMDPEFALKFLIHRSHTKNYYHYHQSGNLH